MAGGLHIARVDRFPGATPWSDRPSLLCTLGGAPPAEAAPELAGHIAGATGLALVAGGGAVELVAELAARLLNRSEGVDIHAGTVERPDGKPTIWLNYIHPDTASQAVLTALAFLADATRPKGPPQADAQYQVLRQLCDAHHPHFQSRILIKAAHRHNIPYLRLGGLMSVWQFGWGRRSNLHWESSSNADGLTAFQITRHKGVQKELIRRLGLPTPDWALILPGTALAAEVERIGLPCAVKPVDRGGGKGVSANLASLAEVEEAVEIARGFSDRPVMIEAHQPGFDHRIMVAHGRVWR